MIAPEGISRSVVGEDMGRRVRQGAIGSGLAQVGGEIAHEPLQGMRLQEAREPHGALRALQHVEAGPLVRIDEFPAVLRVLDAFLARPAVMKGLTIPAASSN